MEKYLTPIKKAITFANFLEGDRHFPDIPIAKLPPSRSKARRFAKIYLALPMPLYKEPVANEAKALAEQYAAEIVDPRKLFANNTDWQKRFEGIIRECSAVFVLTDEERVIPAGCHAEAAFAHALGLPVFAITWRKTYALELRLGGVLRTKAKWYFQWAARYLSECYITGGKVTAERGKRKAA